MAKQAELEALIAEREGHKQQAREKKITARYHKVSQQPACSRQQQTTCKEATNASR